MQSVELLRQPFPGPPETLEELEAIADRIEQLAATADLSTSIRLPPCRNSASPDGDRDRRRLRVLIVEDEFVQATNLEAILSRRGHEVCGIARSGAVAIHMTRTKHPEVVVMDVRLARSTDGVETAAMIRERHGCEVIFLTAYSDRATRKRMLSAGPLAILTKPASSEKIIAAVERGCDLAGRRRGAETPA